MTDEATKQIDDGGPAFPHIATTRLATTPGGEIEVRHTDSGSGMSLRDWFAGQALAGMLSDEMLAETTRQGKAHGIQPESLIAVLAYKTADAMLAERAKVRP
jgi:hypothetical protein